MPILALADNLSTDLSVLWLRQWSLLNTDHPALHEVLYITTITMQHTFSPILAPICRTSGTTGLVPSPCGEEQCDCPVYCFFDHGPVPLTNVL